jgi:hypothetical protein
MKFKTSTFDVNKPVYRRYAHVKLDGYFTKVIKNDRAVTVLSSNGNPIQNKLLWLPVMKQWNALPPGTTLYGELWVTGQTASAVTTAMVERNPDLRWTGFASDQRPDELLENVEERFDSFGLPFSMYRVLESIDDVLSVHREVCFQNLPPFAEGYVLKDGNQLGWIKLKPKKTIDLVVTGWLPGEGKYEDQVGALVCSTIEGFEVCSCSGMTDGERAAMTEAKDRLVGQLVEIQYQNVGAKGRLRHPQFLRWRTEDKAPERCGVDQDSDLKAYWIGYEEVRLC